LKTYAYSEARQRLAELLNRARREGRIQIRRRDGQVFVLQPAEPIRAPLEVPGVTAKLDRGEILAWIKSGREDSAKRLIDRTLPDKRLERTAGKRGRSTGGRWTARSEDG
jgi:prevent-host-death family protein